MLDRTEILDIAREYVAGRWNCRLDDLNKNGIIFAVNEKMPSPLLEIGTMGQATVVSVSSTLLTKVKELFVHKTRDEIFECPLVYGQSIYYVPDDKILKRRQFPSDFEYELLQGPEIQKLNGIKGFENSLAFDENGVTPTCIVLYAMKNQEIVALAGASAESDRMWELGVDVKPEYRKNGLASALVSNLACTILERGIVPFYCASVTNVGSQAAAYRSGFMPCWVSTYRTILDGSSVYHSLLEDLIRQWKV